MSLGVQFHQFLLSTDADAADHKGFSACTCRSFTNVEALDRTIHAADLEIPSETAIRQSNRESLLRLVRLTASCQSSRHTGFQYDKAVADIFISYTAEPKTIELAGARAVSEPKG